MSNFTNFPVLNVFDIPQLIKVKRNISLWEWGSKIDEYRTNAWVREKLIFENVPKLFKGHIFANWCQNLGSYLLIFFTLQW